MGVVFTEMAKSVISATAPNSSSSTDRLSQSSSMSPGKIAGLRSQYLQQMRELHQLFEVGALTEKEFSDQKAPILQQLTRLNPTMINQPQ